MTEAQQNAYDQAQMLIAFSQGHKIEARKKGADEWIEVPDSAIGIQWEYRIKTEPMEIEVWISPDGELSLYKPRSLGNLEWKAKAFREVIE